MTFGEKLTKYRKKADYSLREFAEAVDHDASNISKIERGVHAPPKSGLMLRKWAEVLDLEPDTPEYTDFISSGISTMLQRQVKTEEELMDLLPAFCRTVENRKVDKNTYERLMAILKQNT